MSDTFYKTMKRKEQAEVFETRKQEAIYLMRQYASEKNNNEFFANFVNNLHESISEQRKNQTNQPTDLNSKVNVQRFNTIGTENGI